MPRPKSKEELLEQADINYKKLVSIIEGMTNDELETKFSFDDRDKNVRDVLAHLYEWHQLLIKWISNNRVGEESSFLPSPYNWRTYPQMNLEFWDKHQSTNLGDIFNRFQSSHKLVIELIESFSDEELFTKKYYNWTGTSSLGSYCVSSSSSHYDWALKKVRKHIKSLGKK